MAHDSPYSGCQTGVAFGKALACLKELRLQVHEVGTHRAHQAMVAERGRLATFIADEGIEEGPKSIGWISAPFR